MTGGRCRTVDSATAARIDAAADRLVAAAPPPTDEQIALLRRLLYGTAVTPAVEINDRRVA